MRLDAMIAGPLARVPEAARRLQDLGVDGIAAGETDRDPFAPLLLAAEHTTTPQLVASVAVAFARTPVMLAYQAATVAALAPGRVAVGLGSQVRAHVTKRFGMPWSEPVARMREYVLALRATWDAWQGGRPLAFRGRFYRHTLMPPFFAPELGPHAGLAISVAGTGPRMTAVAGEVADGFVFHLFTTPDHLRHISIPALTAGLERSGRHRRDLTVAGHAIVVTGTGREMDHLRGEVRGQLAFYASTAAYLPVLDRHGLTDVHFAARRMILRGRWADLASVIDDDTLETFAIVGRPAELPRLLDERYGDIADRICVSLPPSALDDVAMWRDVIAEIQALPPPGRRPGLVGTRQGGDDVPA
jgi:probable F420-dependent oxidoreductase